VLRAKESENEELQLTSPADDRVRQTSSSIVGGTATTTLGHTHSTIDERFGKIARALARQDATAQTND